MKRPALFTALLIAVGALSQTSAPAEDASSSESKALQKAAAAAARSVSVYTTWAETGVSATGIASSDFLHNQMSKPASKPIFGENSETSNANVPTVVNTPAPAVAAAEPAPVVDAPTVDAAGMEDAPAPTPAANPQAPKPAAKSKKKAASSSSSRPRSAAPAPAQSRPYSPSRKEMFMDSGKEVYVEDLLVDPPAPFEVSIDAGYQSRYYHLGINRVLAASFIVQPAVAQFFEGRGTEPEDTGVYYGGISADWKGLGVGVKYVRGDTKNETAFSPGDNLVITEFEEIVANINYTLAVLPDGWLNVTGGYRAIFFDEETLFNTDRFDDFFVTIGNSVIPYFRPSISYHYLDQGETLGVTDSTIAPGFKIHEGELLIGQIDGQLDLPRLTGLPVDLIYYAQVGFDNEFNVESNHWDHNWTQVGVSLPIFVGPVTISPNWNYNQSEERLLFGEKEHFWGINVRYDF